MKARTVHTSKTLTSQPLTSLSIFVPNRGCNGTYCVDTEEYQDYQRVLDILDSEGDHSSMSGGFKSVYR